MRPQQPDIDWCLENRDLVARWLGQRGGWQEGDWALLGGVSQLVRCVGRTTRRLLIGSGWYDVNLLWLPTTDDVLEMLKEQGIFPSLSALKSGRWNAWAFPPGHYRHADKTEMPVIALMELLKSMEGENE